MKYILLLFLSLNVLSLPVKEKKVEKHKEEELQNPDSELEIDVEYGRYLKEIIQALEADPEFRKKLEEAKPDDIKSGKIAESLGFVDHKVRTRLDEIKRSEIDRIKKVAIREHELQNRVGNPSVAAPLHLDHKNPHNFESEDLKKLIEKFNHDLEFLDKQRQKEFKTYEMEKQYEYQESLKKMDDQNKKQAEQAHEQNLKKHKDHPKLHHPGSKPQLEEVWEEQDHLAKEDFNPKTFFHLHDIDGNGYWDEYEVEALFKNELDKVYDKDAPEDDMREREEEMQRMREHVFTESDKDNDSLISFDEFMDQAQKNDFSRDEGWQGLDEQELYSPQEYEQFQHERLAEIQRLVDSGAIPPPPGFDGAGHAQPIGIDPRLNQGHQMQPLDSNHLQQNIPAVPQYQQPQYQQPPQYQQNLQNPQYQHQMNNQQLPPQNQQPPIHQQPPSNQQPPIHQQQLPNQPVQYQQNQPPINAQAATQQLPRTKH